MASRFAVNVRTCEPPSWLVSALSPRMPDVGRGELASRRPAVEVTRGAARMTARRSATAPGLTNIGQDVIDGRASFVLFTVPEAHLMRKHLERNRIAVRHGDTVFGEGLR